MNGIWLIFKLKDMIILHLNNKFSLVFNNCNKIESYLIISGGETKLDAGPISESLSYYLLASKLCQNDLSILSRVSTEVFARDSFENVIFLICRYYELFATYPENHHSGI